MINLSSAPKSLYSLRIDVTAGCPLRLAPARSPGATWAWTWCSRAPGGFARATRSPHTFERGLRKVVVAAPVKDGSALSVVVGVNDDRYDPHRTTLSPRRRAPPTASPRSASTGTERRCSP